MIRLGILGLMCLFLLLQSCGSRDTGESHGAGGSPPGTRPLAVWSLSSEPLLEIGVREGPEAYQLHRVTGSVRLPGGRILVANAGSRELRLFSPEGEFLRAVGADGEGPGEFRYPSKIRRLSADSILVWDRSLRRISFFDTDGAFLGARRLLPTRAVIFPGDEWLLDRNWIDSPVAPEDRTAIRRAVEALPAADTSVTVRFLRVTEEGWIWAASRRPPSDSAIDWSVHDLRGREVAHVRTPARFQPHEIGQDYVLGRFQDEMDINFVRLYALEKPAESPPAPGLSPSVGTGAPLDAPPMGPRIPEEVLAGIRSLVKNMASAQEIHYAERYTYTTDVDALTRTVRGGPPEEVEISILFAGTDGWMGTFTHKETGAMCGLSYGYYLPMGWEPGAVICP